MNNDTAKLLLKEVRYPDGANSPTVHKEYACPCGQGKIVEECVPGFDDFWAEIECPQCKGEYRLVYGCGYRWELKKK